MIPPHTETSYLWRESAALHRLPIHHFRIGLSHGGSIRAHLFRRIPFSRSQEQVPLDAMLLGVKVEIAAAQLVEGLMRPALDDMSTFYHQDLIGAPNGGQAVGDHERRAPLHQV